MSNKIKTILDSIKEIEQVKLKPYFYSRLSSKLHKIYEKESFYLKYERPALVFSIVLLFIVFGVKSEMIADKSLIIPFSSIAAGISFPTFPHLKSFISNYNSFAASVLCFFKVLSVPCA